MKNVLTLIVASAIVMSGSAFGQAKKDTMMKKAPMMKKSMAMKKSSMMKKSTMMKKAA